MSTQLIEFGTGQIRQLIEINDARRRRGQPSIGPEVQEVIQRLTSGGVSPATAQGGRHRKGRAKLPARDPRIIQQAKVLWNKGWGQRLGKSSFAEYLLDIPDIPQFPATRYARFPHLVLVDQQIQIVEACQMLGVSFKGDLTTFVHHDKACLVKELVYWMRCQDGKVYRKREPSDRCTEFAVRGDEVGCEAHEGLALYAQFPDLLEVGTVWDLPGSVAGVNRDVYAFLERWTDGGVRLRWSEDGGPTRMNYGSVSRGIM